MPRQAEPTPGPWARAVANAINQLMSEKQISGRALAERTGKSQNYIAMRLRGEASFTLTDVDDFAPHLGYSAGAFLASVSSPADIVGGDTHTESLEDVDLSEDYDLAATHDDSAIDPSRGEA